VATRRAQLAEGRETDERIQQQLIRITSGKTFKQVDRLKRLLNFIVLESLAGRGDQLKEYVIGVQVFEKDASFDPRTDPIVRVVARRLRTRLARYYQEEGASDELLIELPKGGYSPIFKSPEAPPQKRSITTTLASSNSVAVLPFADDSAGGDSDYLVRGIRQEVIHSLVALETLRVVALDVTPDKFHPGGNHDAAIIVCGSVRKAGNLFRITAQLVDSASGCYLWSTSINRGADAVLEAQQEIASAIVERLQSGLAGAGSARAAMRPSVNLAAHNLYLQGRYHLNQRTEDSLKRAADFFERVIVEDANHAQAYSGLADAYGLLNHYGVLPPMEVWTKVASNAAAAVLHDENSAEARTTLAHVKATQDWDWLGAEIEFQRAIRLDSRYATAHHWYATSCLVPTARLDEALEQMQAAQALDPVSPIIARDLTMMLLYKRGLEGALEQCDHTIELNPHFAPAYWTLGLVQEQLGDFDESVAALQRAIQLSPQDPRLQAALARIFALQHMHDEALAILEDLRALSTRRYVSPFAFALIYLALGETDAGFEWMNKAFQDRWFELLFIKADPRFDPFRDDRRFISICHQVGLL
jgi:TolB-like protein/Tfp pilus assembly protein PilF